ncbi:lipopolysaccharide biosynthesis protein [Spongiimicrobium salis]|uniref:lipopolysaccharide biosynthesis protein n=1 Tax=Spongiimicrobium salis TaxID=1667022 RepID=UPI00374DBE6A
MSRKNTLLKVGTMYGATGLKVVLGFLISIFNTRVLGKESYGDLKFIESIVRTITGFTTAGFFISITRILAVTKDKGFQKKLLGYFVYILLIMAAISSAAMFLFSYVEPIFFEHGLSPLFKNHFFVVIAFLTGIAIAEVLKGLNHIYTLALTSILPAIIFLVLAYTISQFYDIGVSTILLLNYGISFFVSLVVILRLKPNMRYGKEVVKTVAQENKVNGRPVYIGSLAGVATTHLATFAISYYLDNTQVGYYTLALTIASPLLMIPSVLGTTFYKQFANIKRIPNKVFLLSFSIAIPALLIFYFFVEKIILLFYSEDYLPAAAIAKFIIIAFIFHGLGDLINRFLGAKGQGKLLRNSAFIVGAVNVIGYPILVKFFGVNGAIMTRILASTSYFVIMFIFYSNFVKKNNYVQK